MNSETKDQIIDRIIEDLEQLKLCTLDDFSQAEIIDDKGKNKSHDKERQDEREEVYIEQIVVEEVRQLLQATIPVPINDAHLGLRFSEMHERK